MELSDFERERILQIDRRIESLKNTGKALGNPIIEDLHFLHGLVKRSLAEDIKEQQDTKD